MKITVVGSGGWGTALALLLVENGHDVTLWSHRPEKAEELRRTRENPMLKGVTLPETMHFTADLACVADCGAVLMVTPPMQCGRRRLSCGPSSAPERWSSPPPRALRSPPPCA